MLGLFQGYGIALTGGVVYRILLLGGYDALKEELLFRKGQDNNNDNNHNDDSKRLSWGRNVSLRHN